MNKDIEVGLGIKARMQLRIGEKNIEREMAKCKQEFINLSDIRCSKALLFMMSNLKCVGCKKIPLNLTECMHCKSIVCEPCHKSISGCLMNNCPEPDCRMSGFQIQPFSSKIMLRQMRKQQILHSCCEHTKADPIIEGILRDGKKDLNAGEDAAVNLYLKAASNLALNKDKETDANQEEHSDFKDWNLAEMIEHMNVDCPKKQKFCPLCRMEFNDYAATREHLRVDCPLVEIVCDTCDKTMTREDFQKHICYLKLANFKEVIEVKDEVRLQALNENEKILQQITDASNQMQVEEAQQKEEIEALEKQLAEMENHTDRQTQMISATRELQDLQRSRFFEGMRSAPTHVNRRYSVNVSTCFDCSLELLTEDLLVDSVIESKVNLDYFFQRARHMTEHSSMHGFTGCAKFCAECKRECIYVQVSGVYYECVGNDGCGRIVCDQCQQMQVLEFESQPYLTLERNSLETNFNALIADLLKHQEQKACMSNLYGEEDDAKDAPAAAVGEAKDGDKAQNKSDDPAQQALQKSTFYDIQKRLFNFFSSKRDAHAGATPGATPGGPDDMMMTPGGPTPGGDFETPGAPTEPATSASKSSLFGSSRKDEPAEEKQQSKLASLGEAGFTPF